jgi:hypothetical protein
MNPDEEQQRLRASFGELRREDQRLAPPFERDWQAAVRLSQRPPPHRFPLARLAAAVAAIAAVGVAAALLNSRPGRDGLVAGRQAPPVAAPRVPEPPEREAPASIEDWESPTAALLELSLEEVSPPGHGPAPLGGGRESF